MESGPIEIIMSGGTFGLPTYGHLEMWLEAARTARKLIIVIANNPGKRPIFSPRERLEMISAMVSDIPNAEVRVMKSKYLVRFAKETGATDVFRGVRNNNDLLEEQIANSVNRLIEPGVSCKLFTPDPAKNQISSSLVFSLIGFQGWEEVVANYVPPVVLTKLKDWYCTREHWRMLWKELDAQDDENIMWHNISSRYGEDHRAYHNLSHITHCLREFELVKHLAADPLALKMAIFYHDIKYDVRAKDNEERSAKFAEAAARKMGLCGQFGKQVARLIKATTHQTPPSCSDARLMADIDLAIFGQPKKVFDRYERGIREEYGWVPYDEFVAARSKILESFLARNSIYYTKIFREKYERKARKNLKRAIKNLSQ
jgi:pantetheine-phosphate adenylyltransferase